MSTPILSKKIPTIVALVLLVGGLGMASYLANTTLRITGFASPEERPENIRITNVTSTSLTISYTTEKAVLGAITYGTSEPLAQSALDETGNAPSTIHSFLLTNLTPQTTYQFFITSGENDFLDDGNTFTTTTASTSGEEVNKTITGSVQNTEGDPVRNALVYVNSPGVQTFSTKTNDNGDFSLRIESALTDSLDSSASLTDETTMQMIIVTNSATSTISFLLGTSHLPAITLAQNYDFTLGKPILLPESPDTTATFPVLPGTPIERGIVEITAPTEGEGFTDQQPEFTGLASPNAEVAITIQSEEQKATVQANQNGEWSYRPETPLAPGEHTITITTRDEGGILRTIRRSFTVYAEGSQFIEPSVSPPPTSPTPTAQSQTQAPTATVTPTPTSELLPTDEPTPTETLAPTSTPLPTLEPSPTITPRPDVGPVGSETLIAISLFSLAFVGLGGILLLFARSSL